MKSGALIDIGVNLTSPQFAGDVDDVIERAFQAEIGIMVAIGVSLESSLGAHQIAVKHPGRVYCTAGVHPHNASQYDDETHLSIKNLLKDDRVLAVGECGLDFLRSLSPHGQQLHALKRQLELAAECGKPLFLHERQAFHDLLGVLKAQWLVKPLPGVVHCFTGTKEQAAAYLDLGLDIGVTGWLCDKRRNADLLVALQGVPRDRVHLETDAPFLMPPEAARSIVQPRRNEPSMLPFVADAVARIWGISVDEVVSQCEQNSRRLFGIPLNITDNADVRSTNNQEKNP
jgi:TatD DNase family protein